MKAAACAALEAVDIRASDEKRKNNSERRKLAGVVRQLSMKTLCLEMQKASGEDISIKMERIRGHDYIVAHGANLLTAAKQNEILGQAKVNIEEETKTDRPKGVRTPGATWPESCPNLSPKACPPPLREVLVVWRCIASIRD